MAARREPREPRETQPRRRPASTQEEQEQRLIMLAYRNAEEQLERREASSQIITQLLKAGTERERLEQRRLDAEVRLAEARIEGMQAMARQEGLLEDAMRWFKGYSGQATPEEMERLRDEVDD